MPLRGRRSNLRRRPAKKNLRRRPRRTGRMPLVAEKGQYCKVIETFEAKDILPNTPEFNSFALADCARAVNIAANFQWYKAAKVIYTYEPLYNTFQDGAGAASKPYMYVVMNRSQQKNPTQYANLSQFQTTGARAQPLTTTRRITYKPNWCSPGLISIRRNQDGSQDLGQTGLKAEYGWLSTEGFFDTITLANQIARDGFTFVDTRSNPTGGLNPYVNQIVNNNNVIYNGHVTFMDQSVTIGSEPVARVTCTIEWHFKGAKNPLGVAPPGQVTEAPVGASA